MEISQTLNVPRLPVEAYWGLCRVYGYQGELTTAQTFAQEGIEIANRAGDEWIASLIRLTMGASLLLASRFELAESWLNRAALGFQESSDPFGEVVSRLWLSMGYLKQGQLAQLERILPMVLTTSEEEDYGFLFTRQTLLGAPEERLFIPLLFVAREHGWNERYASVLLGELGLQNVIYHPGFRLQVHPQKEIHS